MTLPTPLRYARNLTVASVALWFVYSLVTNPAVVSTVLALAALPLLVVVLPALVVWAADSEPLAFELRIGLPTTRPEEREDSTGRVAVTDGGEERV
jgi:hypothetical protein